MDSNSDCQQIISFTIQSKQNIKLFFFLGPLPKNMTCVTLCLIRSSTLTSMFSEHDIERYIFSFTSMS